MAKNSNKKESIKPEVESTKVEETVVETKAETAEKKNKKDSKKNNKKVSKNNAPVAKRSRAKETIGELKKVTWPSFSKTMKQTGMVLSLVLIFGVLVLGIDLLISFIINLLSSF